MPEIGYRYNVDNEELDKLIQIAKLNHPVAILEKLFCMNGEKKEHFDYLNEETIVSEWDIGRVFDINSEIRWEKEEEKFHVIWIINNGNLTSEWKCDELGFKVNKNRRILLWGEKIKNQERWYEKQIPKIFKYPVNGEKYLFSWEEISVNDSVRLKGFLRHKYGIDWIKTAIIEKIDKDKTLKISIEKRFILLKLNKEKTKLYIEINDVRTGELIAKTENDKINIYGEINRVYIEVEEYNILSDGSTVYKFKGLTTE